MKSWADIEADSDAAESARRFGGTESPNSYADELGGGGLKRDQCNGGMEVEALPLALSAVWARTQPKPKEQVLAGRVPKREVTILTGDGGTNKSTCGHQIAVCRAAGLPFLGIDLEPGLTLYITAEDNFDRLHWTHNHICEGFNVAPLNLLGRCISPAFAAG